MPKFKAEVPTNIAFLKYWGKASEEEQWPANDSISMSLDRLRTVTIAEVIEEGLDHEFYLEGQLLSRNDEPKVFLHLDRIQELTKRLKFLRIESHNTMPKGCGVASSASGFGALSLAALAAYLEGENFKELDACGFSRERIAHIARMGSGSAGRSLWGGFVQWQKGTSSELQRIVPLAERWNLCDIVLLVSMSEKPVSSSKAHLFAQTSPLYQVRQSGIEDRCQKFLDALIMKDMKNLGELLELECLEMHSVIMTATPPVFYWEHHVAKILSWVRKLRKNESIEVYFTLDAGPNVHLICEMQAKAALLVSLKRDFPEMAFISDAVGNGPTLGWV